MRLITSLQAARARAYEPAMSLDILIHNVQPGAINFLLLVVYHALPASLGDSTIRRPGELCAELGLMYNNSISFYPQSYQCYPYFVVGQIMK